MPQPGRDARGRFTAGAGFTGGGGGDTAGADLSRALQETTSALRRLDDTTSRALSRAERDGEAGGGLGRVAGIGAIAAVAGAAAEVGAGQLTGAGGSVETSTFRSAAGLASVVPGLGQLTGQITNPLDRAEQRLGAITSVIARAGGEVSPELRNSLARRFATEEVRVERELERTSAAINQPGNFDRATEGTALGAFGRTVNDALDRLLGGRQR